MLCHLSLHREAAGAGHARIGYGVLDQVPVAVILHCTGEWQELGARAEGRLVSYVQDWSGWWLAVVRDRPAGKLNGELQALPIRGQSSPQVRLLAPRLRVCLCMLMRPYDKQRAGCRRCHQRPEQPAGSAPDPRAVYSSSHAEEAF